MYKIPDEILENKYKALVVVLMSVFGGFLLFDQKFFVLLYIIILISGSLYLFSGHINSAGQGTKDRIRISIELNVLILAAALFFFLRSITPELSGVQIGATDQAYLVLSICGYTFLYSVFFKEGGIYRGVWRKFLMISCGIILIVIPVAYYVLLVIL